jgi:phage replication-related protein YjqB (UPF0714/DUF867 family)
MLDQLLAAPGVTERFVAGSRFGFCAIHGGLEQGTAEIAEAAATASGATFYAVVQPDNLRWHVPSHRYDTSCSDLLREFVASVDAVVSVHGFGGLRDADDRWTTALLGGRNRTLATTLGAALAVALPGYRWVTDLDAMPARLRGQHPQNPVNRVTNAGVQLELPPRVRRAGADYDALVDALASVASSATSGSRCATSL